MYKKASDMQSVFLCLGRYLLYTDHAQCHCSGLSGRVLGIPPKGSPKESHAGGYHPAKPSDPVLF